MTEILNAYKVLPVVFVWVCINVKIHVDMVNLVVMYKTPTRKGITMTKPKKQKYTAARTALCGAVGVMGGVAVFGWVDSLWTESLIGQAVAVSAGVGFAVSAIVTPAFVDKVAHARGSAFIGMLIVCAAFGAIDTVGVDRGLNRFEHRMTQAEFDADQLRIDNALEMQAGVVATAAATLDKAQAALDAVPALDKAGPISRLASWESVMQMRTAARDAAKADLVAERAALAALPTKAVRADLIDSAALLALAGLVQLALAIGFISLEATSERRYNTAMVAYDKARAKVAAERRAKAKRRASARESKPKTKERFTPYVVHANDNV